MEVVKQTIQVLVKPVKVNLKKIMDGVEQRSKHAALGRLRSLGFSQDESEAFILELYEKVPNLKGALRKYVEGIVRWFTQGDLNPELDKDYSKVNLLLRVLQNSPAIDALDKNFVSFLTGDECSYQEVLDMVGMTEGFAEGEVLNADHLYDIVEIESHEDLEPYNKYIAKWCVTSSEDVFDHYTQNGLYHFYICLRDDYKTVPAVPQENFPKDDYGLSIIAVIIDDEGHVMGTTSRWNSTSEADNFLTDDELVGLGIAN